MKIKHLLVLVSLFLVQVVSAEKVLRYENYIYEDQIHTVQFLQKGTQHPIPLIKLGGTDRLTLSFDELSTDNDYYQYTLIHCDAYWRPSNLKPLEYLSGNNFEYINDFSYSQNTYQKYVHYSVNVPGTEMKPKYSGNYLLKVYRNFDEKDIIITRKLFILDAKAGFEVDIHPATLAGKRFSSQEIDMKIKVEDYQVVNPYQDLKLVISQNNRWDNAIGGIPPQFIVGNEYTYNYEKENVFDGINEFRFCDFRSLRFFSQNVQRKHFDSLYHLELKTEEKRGSKRYYQYIDFNGKQVIANKDGQNDGSTDGDYVWVYFSMESTAQLRTGDVYVYGALSDWRAQDKFKMTYNDTTKKYELKVLLKQGYYSYLFATKNSTTGVMETIETEGNYMETENDYYIYYYCRNQLLDYDELIGYTAANSSKK